MRPVNLSDPAVQFAAIAPSDTDPLPGGACRGIHCVVDGDAVLVGSEDPIGSAGTTFTMVAGAVYGLSVRQVKATDTTATLVALY